MARSPLLAAAMLLALAVPAPAADEGWTLVTADFKSEPVALESIDTAHVGVVPAGQAAPREVPLGRFLQVDRSVAPAERPAKFMLYLVGGDCIGGEPAGLRGEQVVWTNAAVGELVIPLTRLAAMTRPGQSPEPGRRTEDVVVLANGDTVRGIVTGVTAEQVRVKPPDGDEALPVPLEAILSVHFATAAAPQPPGGRAFRVRLDDGSSIVATGLTLREGELRVTLDGGEPRALELASVSGIEQVNGPVSWLTSREPAEDVYVPFLASAQPLWRTRVDADVAGAPFVVGGKALRRGIGVHSYSRLVYPLDGSHEAFRTRYGMNDSLTRGDVTVRIKLDDEVVHERANVRPGALSPVVTVKLGDAKRLTLEVDYGAAIDVEDRLNWLEPALLREAPAGEGARVGSKSAKPRAAGEASEGETLPKGAPPPPGESR